MGIHKGNKLMKLSIFSCILALSVSIYFLASRR